jgi:hypothetical protein
VVGDACRSRELKRPSRALASGAGADARPASSRLPLRTNSSSARPSPAGCCFVCDCERVHDTARASQPPRQGPSVRSRSAGVSSTAAPVRAVHQGPVELFLLVVLATCPTATCLGGATVSLVAVSWRMARAEPHSQAVGIGRLRAAQHRPLQLPVHADRGAARAERRRRHPLVVDELRTGRHLHAAIGSDQVRRSHPSLSAAVAFA